MRVDSCTTQVKECLQSEDRCGADYTQCVGLDTDSIIRMCPYDKLVGCQQVYSAASGEKSIKGNEVYDELSRMVQGIFLNIDNNMLTACQTAANEAMVKVCGGTEDCNGLAVDEGVGGRSVKYQVCPYTGNTLEKTQCRNSLEELTDNQLFGVMDMQTGKVTEAPSQSFAGAIVGDIYWSNIDVKDDGTLTSAEEYATKLGLTADSTDVAAVREEVALLTKSVNNAIKTIEADPTVQYCMTGREVQGMKIKETRQKVGSKDKGAERFPELTKQMRMIIAQYALKMAKENYYAKYDAANDKLMKDYVEVGKRAAARDKESGDAIKREWGRRACLALPSGTVLPMSPEPPKNAFGKILSTVAIVGAAVAIPFTGGASAFAIAGIVGASSGAIIAGAAVGVAAIGVLGNAGSGSANGSAANSVPAELTASSSMNQWNFKQVVNSVYNWDTRVCEVCTKSQTCGKTKNPVFGNKYCGNWNEETNNCAPRQF
jgi:hypothetical protein